MKTMAKLYQPGELVKIQREYKLPTLRANIQLISLIKLSSVDLREETTVGTPHFVSILAWSKVTAGRQAEAAAQLATEHATSTAAASLLLRGDFKDVLDALTTSKSSHRLCRHRQVHGRFNIFLETANLFGP